MEGTVNAVGGGRRTGVPLYLLMMTLSAALVAITAMVLRLFGQLPAGFQLVLAVAFVLPLAWVAARLLVKPLAKLADEAAAVRRFDFADHAVLQSGVREIDQLGGAFDLMRDAVRHFTEINRRLAIETDFDALLPWLLGKMVEITAARAGVLYFADADGVLRAIASEFVADEASTGIDLPALDRNAMPRLLAQAQAADGPVAGRVSAAELAGIGIDPGLAGSAALAVPLRDRKGELLGMLLLFTDGSLGPGRIGFIAAVAASAATSLETQELVHGQKRLLEAVIRMVAGAIDAQSPYTGGHCERVPELTFMLARAACAAESGPYADFDLDAEAWEALHVGAWLHDCGKVATPEHVVDKATKLETVYDRIHEIRTRFEVLKRDADIDYWRGVAEGGDEPGLRAHRDALKAVLDEEFAFVARCNLGGEFLHDDQRQRLREIGARPWLRTLDDRLGLSRDALARMPAGDAGLPVRESLLADKPEHRIARPAGETIPPDNRWGFRVEVPELLYNHGELHNLTIGRGTLTEEDRYKINEHMVHTIRMLSELPFPRHLRAVPEIAGGHHEKMDGTGYPRRLDRDRLSPMARMMAIADIFEALTAGDRPYKPGKTLPEALSIMARMRDGQHIDPDLFDLFLRSGVHLDYAQRFMQPEQFVEVRIEDYL